MVVPKTTTTEPPSTTTSNNGGNDNEASGNSYYSEFVIAICLAAVFGFLFLLTLIGSILFFYCLHQKYAFFKKDQSEDISRYQLDDEQQ